MGLRDLAKQVLVEQQNRRYEKLLGQKQTSYAQWTERRRLFAEGESKIRSADYQVFVSEQGRLSADAGIKIDCYFKDHPEVMLAYGDEDVWGSREEASHPWFKPDWSPDVFMHHDYLGGVIIMRKSLIDAVERGEDSFENWVYRCVEVAGGFEKGSKAIGHISEVLFHHEYEETLQSKAREIVVTVPEDETIADETLQENNDTLLSIIIPSKDNPTILKKCVASIVEACENLRYEVIVVDNGSTEENKNDIDAFLQEMSTQEHLMYYLYYPMEFHFSKMCNLGARAAKGEVFLFLNDDVELCQDSGVEQLMENARRPHTGAVGIKLYYPESRRIQHAGIVNLPMGPVHKLQFMEDDKEYSFDSNRCPKNVMAVTAACMMVEKEKFLEAGGFPMDLRVAFNDVSLCFRLFELGYHNVCRNDFYAYHHESLSRGDDESTEKLERLMKEREVLYQKHPAMQGYDPYYSMHFSREGLDTRIRPIYETCKNQIQKPGQDAISTIPKEVLDGYRQDQCMLVRVESFIENKLQGYGVVLGDNNACYDKYVLFQDEAGKNYQIPIEGQYRPDLVENMPDQVNVGLSGFHMDVTGAIVTEQTARNMGNGVTGLFSGRYRIGLLARNRVGSLVIYNWSNRYIDI